MRKQEDGTKGRSSLLNGQSLRVTVITTTAVQSTFLRHNATSPHHLVVGEMDILHGWGSIFIPLHLISCDGEWKDGLVIKGPSPDPEGSDPEYLMTKATI